MIIRVPKTPFFECIFSKSRKYRYSLSKTWNPNKKTIMFIGLNPSTATELKPDPTITRCLNFSKDWGFGSFHMLNLFAFRATLPKDMFNHPKPIGKLNNKYLIQFAKKSNLILAAWGNHGSYLNRSYEVKDILLNNGIKEIHFLSLTKSNEPGHPLYLPKNLKPQKMILKEE